MDERSFQSYELAVSVEAPGKARATVSKLEQIDDLELHDARLLISELVTNAVLHSGLDKDDTIELAINLDDDRLRVEVADAGVGFDINLGDDSLRVEATDTGVGADDAQALNYEEAEFGRGLQLVDALADRWGIPGAEGCCVWFELDHSRYHSAGSE